MVDLEDVGANMQDQAILALQYEVTGTTLSTFLNDPAAYDAALAQWSINQTGIAAGNTVVNTIGYLRLPNESSLLAATDPAAGPNSAHYQLSFLASPSIISSRQSLMHSPEHLLPQPGPGCADNGELDVCYRRCPVPNLPYAYHSS